MGSSLAHGDARHFRYQKLDRPFRGSLRNATAMITSVDATPVSEEEYLSLLRAAYPRYYAGIEWVRFHSFRGGWRKRRDQHYRLAVVNVTADPVLRPRPHHGRSGLPCRREPRAGPGGLRAGRAAARLGRRGRQGGRLPVSRDGRAGRRRS